MGDIRPSALREHPDFLTGLGRPNGFLKSSTLTGTDIRFIDSLTALYADSTFIYGDVTTQASLGSARILKTIDPQKRVRDVECDLCVAFHDPRYSMKLSEI